MARRLSKEDQRAELKGKIDLHKGGAREETFREELRELNRNERKSAPTERQDVRLPGAALLIVIGLFVLWIAATGNLKRIAAAWDFVLGKTASLPNPTGAVGAAKGLTGIVDFSNYHVESMLAQPTLSITNPGGLT